MMNTEENCGHKWLASGTEDDSIRWLNGVVYRMKRTGPKTEGRHWRVGGVEMSGHSSIVQWAAIQSFSGRYGIFEGADIMDQSSSHKVVFAGYISL